MSQDKTDNFLAELRQLVKKYWQDDWYLSYDIEEDSVGLSLHTGYMLEDSGLKDDCNG